MILKSSIYLLTWNVVTVEPPPSDQLQSLLDSNADFIAIGLQEVKSQPQNLIADNLYEDSWTNSFRYELFMICCCQL
jgi:exonuclease III